MSVFLSLDIICPLEFINAEHTLPVHLTVYISAADRDINKINVQDIHVELYDKNKSGRGKIEIL